MKNKQKIGGFRGLGGGILILEQYTERIVITNHHTKFQPDSSKRLEVIQSWNIKKRWGTNGQTHRHKRHPPRKNYSPRRNLFRRGQKMCLPIGDMSRRSCSNRNGSAIPLQSHSDCFAKYIQLPYVHEAIAIAAWYTYQLLTASFVQFPFSQMASSIVFPSNFMGQWREWGN